MSDTVQEIFACRSCHSADLVSILNIGNQYISAFPDSRENGERDGKKVPLNLVVCRQCWLVQLKHTTPPDWLYRHFWYRSGITKTMRDTLAEIAHDAANAVSLHDGDYVCDIGANDGTLLRNYPVGVNRVGYEPATNLSEECREGGNLVVNDYFSADWLPERRYKVITAIAMFYDLDDPNKFLADIKKSLDPDGVFVIQMNYLLTMLRDCAFDNISHEHLTYYSLTSLLPLLSRHGFHVVSASLNTINGGSIRITCSQNPYSVVDGGSLTVLLDYERTMGLASTSPYEHFSRRVTAIGTEIKSILRSNGQEKSYVCGASTRGNVLLQYFGLDNTMLAGASERDERKFGKVTIGSWLPILNEVEVREKADLMLVLPWAFEKEITERESAFLDRGGKLVFPMPRVKVVKRTEAAKA